MKARVHLLDVDEPLLAFSHLRVRCGVELKTAKTEFQLSERFVAEIRQAAEHLKKSFKERALLDFDSEFPALSGICPDCIRAEPSASDERRIYVYGLIEAQDDCEAA